MRCGALWCRSGVPAGPSSMRLFLKLILSVLCLLLCCSCGKRQAGPARTADGRPILRIGHFPNITHAHALVAAQMKRQGKGWFEERLGVETQWFVYNAGPSAMEAIFVDSVDVTYVGPNPVLNAYSRAQGDEIRIVAGATIGGAALVVQGDGRIKTPADFRARIVATPQMGNTQDVAARVWLKQQGFNVTQIGGEVSVVPSSNPDILNLFNQKKIDAAWTVEPWVTRLEREGGGQIFLEETHAITTVLASSVKFLKEQPELAKKFVAAHDELTKWINEHPDEARELVRAELKVLSKREFPAATAEKAWSRLKFTSDISRDQLEKLVTETQSVGFLKKAAPLDRLIVELR